MENNLPNLADIDTECKDINAITATYMQQLPTPPTQVAFNYGWVNSIIFNNNH